MNSKKHKLTNQLAKTWSLDQSKISKANLELLKEKNFPFELPASQVIMKRLFRRDVSGVFVDKEVITKDDVIYLKTSRNIADMEAAKFDTNGRTPEETKAKIKYAEDAMKTKSYATVFIDAVHAQEELELFLKTFGEPEMTESMKAALDADKKEKAEKLDKKEKAEKVELTPEQEAIISEKYQGGSLAADEIAELLDVKKSLVTNFIKSLPKA